MNIAAMVVAAVFAAMLLSLLSPSFNDFLKQTFPPKFLQLTQGYYKRYWSIYIVSISGLLIAGMAYVQFLLKRGNVRGFGAFLGMLATFGLIVSVFLMGTLGDNLGSDLSSWWQARGTYKRVTALYQSAEWETDKEVTLLHSNPWAGPLIVTEEDVVSQFRMDEYPVRDPLFCASFVQPVSSEENLHSYGFRIFSVSGDFLAALSLRTDGVDGQIIYTYLHDDAWLNNPGSGYFLRVSEVANLRADRDVKFCAMVDGSHLYVFINDQLMYRFENNWEPQPVVVSVTNGYYSSDLVIGDSIQVRNFTIYLTEVSEKAPMKVGE